MTILLNAIQKCLTNYTWVIQTEEDIGIPHTSKLKLWSWQLHD